MVSTRAPSSKSSSPFYNPLVTVPKGPITIGIIVTWVFHSFSNSLARSRYISFFSHSFSFILWSAGTAKSTILQVLFFFFFLSLIIIRSGLPCVCRSPIGVFMCYFLGEELGCAYNICHYYYYYDYYSLIRAFHISNSRWFFTEVWVTASLLKSPGLFLVFWQFSTMLSFGWSPLVRQPPSPLVPLVIP